MENRGEIKHGTLYAYFGKGCRCALCRKASADYQHARFLAGKTSKKPRPRVPVAEAQWRLRRLKERGMGLSEISRATGLSICHLRNIEQAKYRTVQQSTLKVIDRVLRSGKRAPANKGIVDGTKTTAIIDLLVDMLGFKGACKALDWCPSQLKNFLKRDTSRVRLSTKEHVEERARLLIRAAGLDRTHAGRMQIAKASGMVVNPYTEEDYERREWWRR